MVLNVTDAVYPERQPADHSAGCPVSCVKLYFIMVYPHGNYNYKICTKWLQFVFYLQTNGVPRHRRGTFVHRFQLWCSSAQQPVQRILQAEVGSMRISHGTLISYFSAVFWAA